ncbi:MAG: carboxypeptidase-like regulatory domain-containing protein [Bacteroidota bacterium]
MKLPTLLLLLLLPYVLTAQSRLTGQIFDGSKNTPLAYVNIGVLGAGIGTVSDSDGSFSFSVPSRLNQETVKLSMLGYESKTFGVAEFRQLMRSEGKVVLKPKQYDLEQIVVVPDFTKTKVIGNPARRMKRVDGFDGDKLGREGGIIIKLKRRFQPAKVIKFQLYIAYSTYDQLKFRLNFYSVKNNVPFKPLAQENVIITTDLKEGILEVDLEQYDIVVQDDFAVTLEWIEDFGDGRLRFPFRRYGPRCVFRNASQDRWESYSGLLAPSPALNVTIGYN